MRDPIARRLEDLECQVETLRKQSRNWSRIATVASIGLVCLLSVGATQQKGGLVNRLQSLETSFETLRADFSNEAAFRKRHFSESNPGSKLVIRQNELQFGNDDNRFAIRHLVDNGVPRLRIVGRDSMYEFWPSISTEHGIVFRKANGPILMRLGTKGLRTEDGHPIPPIEATSTN